MSDRIQRLNPEGLAVPSFPYAQTTVAVRAGLLFISGQGPIDENGNVVGETMAEQTDQVFRNLEAALKAHGCGFEDVLKLGMFLTDITAFDEFTEVRKRYLKGVFPAATLVAGIRLVSEEWKVEAEAVAALP